LCRINVSELAHTQSEKELQALQAQKEQLEIQVKQQQAQIAELEAKLAQAQTVSEQETEVIDLNDESSQPREQLIERLTTWQEVAAFVKRDCNKLLKLVKNGGRSSQEQVLVELLSAHLKKESPDALEQLAWVQKKLLDKALLSWSREKFNLSN
jgi:multidrug resistance efflux pump